MLAKKQSGKSSKFCCDTENSFILDLHLSQINIRQALFDKDIKKPTTTQGIHRMYIFKK